MFSIPSAVFAEAFLSFIGLGVRIPGASLGTLANDGYKYIDSCPWLFFIPVLVIIAIMLAFNIIGDGIRDMTDPKSSSRL
jgi:oligopeptide transport system permease protein